MPLARNIFLVGFMASGKTSVGRALSQATGWALIDADDEIVLRAGKPIARIFEDSGEDAFRELERSVIKDLCGEKRHIIAAGGGAFVDSANQSRMLESGAVVCLEARPETIYRRLLHEDGGAAVRPLLSGDDPMGRIEELLAQRRSAYAKAHHTIDTDEMAPEQIADRVLELLKQ
jgi:shikimate kinase